jgi:thiol-disulfide isomerase/thioredoxin
MRRSMLADKRKFWINIILSITGIAVAVLHSTCEESCAYLKGSVFGLALNYYGIFFMGILILSNLLKKDLPFLLFLSFGIGAELYLLGFQISNNVYCYYCLAFGAILFILFLLNFERSKKGVIIISLIIGFILFSVFFEGSTTPVYAEDALLPSFGSGQIKVRLYTDYFCTPCRALEPKLEPVIRSLVKKGVITLTFIDTPIHPQTPLYAQYFLSVLNENKDFDNAIRARSVLFEASKENITDYEKLDGFMKKKGIRTRQFDPKSTFGVLSSYLKEDKINATPTCIIYNKGNQERFTGLDIIKALENIR